MAFHFTNSDATFDTHAENTNDLRDNQWHNVAVTFAANQAGGLKYYVDGNLVYTHSGSFAPISNQSDNETPRFGYVGMEMRQIHLKVILGQMIYFMDIFKK